MASCTLRNTPLTTSPASADWQSVLAEAVRSPAELCRLLGLQSPLAAEAVAAADGFPLLVPRPYLARIRPGDPADPLLVQVLPRAAEMAATPGYQADPLSEADALCAAGLMRKYQGRILMLTTGSCAVHCRFCFRRHFSYDSEPVVRPEGLPLSSPPHCNGGAFRQSIPIFSSILQKIAADRSIHEVILSGGDPLVLPDCELAQLAQQLADVPHLRRLRIHTRLPVMIPRRVTDELIYWIRDNRLSTVMVIHVNHPAEVDGKVAESIGRLVDAGIPVLSQSVLLRGVNDRIEVLAELCERLVDLRVIPYYLHQLDAVAGAAHFEVPVASGVALVAQLRARLPGYAVPRYVRETPGAECKEVLV